jgi:23S rRNA (guanosine2251-2'-O)-methyltransferase
MPGMRRIVLIVHNVRSTHNVGSLLRTAEGLGVTKVYLTGYTPYPHIGSDTRLPHIADKLHDQIHKTSLDAEDLVDWEHDDDIEAVLQRLKAKGFVIAAIEQTTDALPLPEWQPGPNVALIVGREVEGVEPEVLALSDVHVEIPMFGKKESFNVVQSAAMALYHCRFSK